MKWIEGKKKEKLFISVIIFELIRFEIFVI